jgi:endonuclease YncB( thermonuclease family)
MEAGVTRLGRVVVAALVACGVAAGPGAAQPVRFVNGTVAHVVDGRSLNRELLRAGLGWWNRRYEPHDHDLQRLEAAARAARRGLWSEPEPVPPWRHRRATR